MGLTNVTIMIPFCRTVEELKKVYKVMKKYGLQRGKDGLQVYLMAELPSNILMAEEFAQHIDGFSIGSNDLTQLTLGLDRDSSLVAHIYDERNPAVKRSISNLIKVAKKDKYKSWNLWSRTIRLPRFCTIFSRRRNRYHFGNS